VEGIMKDSERRLLTDLRRALLPLHKTLLEWERKIYEREHGRKMGAGELLQIIMTAPQFAWLHPISEVIVRIDQALDEEAPDMTVDVDAILTQARRLVAPDQTEKPYAQRYLTALQEVPDVVVAHGKVTAILKENPARETLH
jgi:hypothetical protein